MSSPYSQLYLKLLNQTGEGSPVKCVEAALRVGGVAALLIGAKPETGIRDYAEGLVLLAHAQDVAVVVLDDAKLALSLGADGVQVPALLEDYYRARSVLGDDAIVGVSATPSRHAALELAEAGASYVSFEDNPADEEADSVWWAKIMEVPCVANVPPTDEALIGAARAGIEFISPDETMWSSAKAAESALIRFNNLTLGV